MPKKAAAPETSHIIVGFSFPSEKNPSEIITGSTRHSIRLSLSSQLYARWMTTGEKVNPAAAEKLAAAAFEYADIYLKRLDLEVAKTAPPP